MEPQDQSKSQDPNQQQPMTARPSGPVPVEDNSDLIMWITYGLFGLGLFFFVPMIAGIVMAHIKYGETRGSIDLVYQSHYRWLIRTFWYGLLWSAIAIPLIFVVVGYFVLLGIWIWTVYRIVRGFLGFIDRKPMYVYS